MSVTIKDIAAEAGVASSTVSKALNNRGSVSLPLRQKIRKIAERLGYAPYVKARERGMYASSTPHIAVIYAFAGDHLVAPVQKAIDGAIGRAGYYEVRYTVNPAQDVYARDKSAEFFDKIICDKSIAGVISAFFHLVDAVVARFQRAGLPVVILNSRSDCAKCVVTNNAAVNESLATMLLESGRRRIGVVMPEEGSESIWQLRLDGYKAALGRAGLAYDPGLLVYESTFTLEGAARATKELVDRYADLDAIMYGSDVQAYGGLEALKELGKSIPGEIAVTGFDDMSYSRVCHPPLTSIRQPMEAMGRTAAELLLQAIQRKDLSPSVTELESKIVRRQSTHSNVPRETFLK